MINAGRLFRCVFCLFTLVCYLFCGPTYLFSIKTVLEMKFSSVSKVAEWRYYACQELDLTFLIVSFEHLRVRLVSMETKHFLQKRK